MLRVKVKKGSILYMIIRIGREALSLSVWDGKVTASFRSSIFSLWKNRDEAQPVSKKVHVCSRGLASFLKAPQERSLVSCFEGVPA